MLNKTVLSIAFLCLCCVSAHAADLHVGSGQTYSTIASAITASSAGDTIYVHEGTYNESDLHPKGGIDNANRMLITSVDGESMPVVDAQQGADTYIPAFNIEGVSYVTLYGLDIRGGGGHSNGTISIGQDGTASYITIDSCKISETNVGGTLSSYNPAHIWIGYSGTGTDVTISNNEITGAYASGLKIDSRSGHYSEVTVINNYIHDVFMGVGAKWGVEGSDRGITITNNLISDTGHYGLYINQAYTVITNNVFDTSATTSIRLGNDFDATYCTIDHNTVYGGSAEAIYFSGGCNNNTLTNNILYNSNTISDYGSGNDGASGNYTTDPDFADAVNNDFTLDIGSGAIGTATGGTDYGADIDAVGPDGTIPTAYGECGSEAAQVDTRSYPCTVGTSSSQVDGTTTTTWACVGTESTDSCSAAYSETVTPTGTTTAYSLLDGSVIPYKLTTE